MADPTDLMVVDEDPDEAVANEVWDQYKDARNYRKQYDKDWQRYYLLYASRQWTGQQKEWQSTPIINLIWSTINTIVPILTDRKPNIQVMPRQPENEHIAGVLGSILDWLWEAQSMDTKLPMVMTNALIFGNGFLKVLWDPNLRQGLGDIAIKPVDPVHIFLSPHATCIEDSEYVIHAENLPRKTVDAMYPGVLGEDNEGAYAPELNVVRNITSQLNQGGVSSLRPQVKTSDAPGSISTSSHDAGDPNQSSELITVLERWLKVQGGLMQTVVINDKHVFTKPWDHTQGRVPIIHFVDVPHTWSAWAMGEVQQVEKLQIEINRRRGHIMDILNLTAHPIMAVNPAEAIGYEDWEIHPGLIIPVEGGPASVGWINPPAIPNALFEVNRMDKEDFDIVLGNVDVLQGRRPEGIEAGIAIEMLQEAANVRMRLKVRYMEASLRRLGEICVGMIQSFYDVHRIFRLAGVETGQLEKPLTPDMAPFFEINKPDPAGAQGALTNEIPGDDSALFDVRIGPGSTLPVSRSTQFQKALTLYSMQILDDVGVMKASGIPRWEEELIRSREYWGMKMMAQAQMQAQQGGAEGEGPSDEEIESEAASQDVPEASSE